MRFPVRHKISITKPFSDTALQDYVVSIVTRRGYDRCKWGLSQLLHVLRTCCHMLLTAVDKLKVDLTLWLALTRELRLKPKSESPSDVLSSEKLSDSWLFYKKNTSHSFISSVYVLLTWNLAVTKDKDEERCLLDGWDFPPTPQLEARADELVFIKERERQNIM